MAEIATILTFAQTGFKLSMTLFSFASAIGSAGKDIIQTGKDISLFSSVLRQLGLTMQRAHKSGLISDDAFQDTAKIVVECKQIFANLDALIEKATSTEKIKVIRMEEDDMEVKELDRDNLTVSYGKRLMYLFRKSEILEQKKALDSLKSSLQLLLMLMMFTENKVEFGEDGGDPTIRNKFLADEKLGLESLVLANQAATSEYRKQRPRTMFKKNETIAGEAITNFGIIGQLATPRSSLPVPLSVSSHNQPEHGCLSTMPTGRGSMYIPQMVKSEKPKSSSVGLASLLRSNVEEPQAGFVIIPPTLRYNHEGNITPYSSAYNVSRHSHSYYEPPPNNEQVKMKDEFSSKVKALESQPSSSTPSFAVDMLLKRMATQKGRRPSRANVYPRDDDGSYGDDAHRPTTMPEDQSCGPQKSHGDEGSPPWAYDFNQYEASKTKSAPQEDRSAPSRYSARVEEYDEEEDEPIIDLFPQRQARPY